MARRSHNETFILLRNNALKNRSFYKDFNKDDERVKLVTATDDDQDEVYDLELSNYSVKSLDGTVNGYRGNVAFPSWLPLLDEFRYEAFNIREKIEQLKKIQEEHLKQQNNAIFADDIINERLKNYELEIDKRCQELNELFNRMHSILQHFQALKANFSNQNHIGTSGSNRMISTMIRNIFQYQVQEVCNLTQLFRSCQRVYVDRRNEATKVDPEFVITFDEDLLKEELANNRRLIDNTFDDSVYLDLNQNNGPTAQLQSQTQLALDDQIEINSSINAHLKEREREMNSILKSFVELNQIFREVNALVVDQGSALDRIDYNLEQVEQRVEMGAVILEKAHRNITRVRKLKIVLGAGLLIFLLLLFIIIRS